MADFRRHSILETQIVLVSRSGSNSLPIPHELIERAGVVVVAFDEPVAEAAFGAPKLFGKGQGHKAPLNIIDGAAYALAKTRGLPLLFKGNDFAWRPVAEKMALTLRFCTLAIRQQPSAATRGFFASAGVPEVSTASLMLLPQPVGLKGPAAILGGLFCSSTHPGRLFTFPQPYPRHFRNGCRHFGNSGSILRERQTRSFGHALSTHPGRGLRATSRRLRGFGPEICLNSLTESDNSLI